MKRFLSATLVSLVLWGQPCLAQLPERTVSSDVAPNDVAPSEPDEKSGEAQLALQLELKETQLNLAEVIAALAEEFGFTPLAHDPEGPAVAGLLSIFVQGRSLRVSFRDDTGQAVERRVKLPFDRQRSLDTVALLAGNLARDEADALLAEMRAREEALQAPPLPPAEEAPAVGPKAQPTQTPTKALEESAARSDQVSVALPQQSPPKKPSLPAKKPLKEEDFTVSFAGRLAYPGDLSGTLSHFELGFAYSELGAIEGVAGTLFASNILGAGPDGAGKGAQLAGLWAHNEGQFEGATGAALLATSTGRLRGAQLSAIAASSQGKLEGAQVAGLAGVVRGNTEGAQLSGIANLHMGDLQGAQLAGGAAILRGDVLGVQGAGGVVSTIGNVEGAQLAALATFCSGEVRGGQAAAFNIAAQLTGAQVGVANLAAGGLDGFQLGVVNVSAGDELSGAQMGLVNVAGRGAATQVGVINVAQHNDGTSLGLLNFVPGQRTQAVSYASYAEHKQRFGYPQGPMGHLAVKYLPNALYTQLGLGLGRGVEECRASTTENTSRCRGGGLVLAPSLALGVRGEFGTVVFAEVDLSYQFEKALEAPQLWHHALLARAALGFQLSDSVALFVGGGPRVNLSVDQAQSPLPDAGFSPHGYAGVQFF